MDPLAHGLNDLTAALTALGIRYFVSGSVASSARGVIRGTLDGDLVALIFRPHLKMLVNTLGANWYADLGMMEHAVEQKRAFNLIHMPSAMKFDVFPAYTDFHESELERATLEQLPMEGTRPCIVASSEDCLLSKLQWYREGGEVSARQWSDIGGILRMNRSLDWEYVNGFAARLSVADLLARARVEAEL